MLRERTRLAAELHDTVAQGLTSMRMLLDAADRQWTREPVRARQLVRQAAEAASENLEEARRLIRDLAPPELDGSSLPEAVRRLCEGARGARFRLEGEPRPLGAAVEGAALRAVQGALANVRAHARASNTVVTLTYQAGALNLDVWDDGIGFAPDAGPGGQPAAELAGQSAGRSGRPSGGDGLRLLRRRVGHLGGRAVVESTPGGGTVVSVRLPVRDPA
ncbi:sensor histidine kinase [Streptomyces sp. NPDC054956]